MCVGGKYIHFTQLSNLMSSCDMLCLGFGIKNCSSFLVAWMFWFGPCCQLNVTLQSPCPERSRASDPSIRNAACREMILDSVELCETAVCFLHIQLIGTKCSALPKKHIIHLLKLILSPQWCSSKVWVLKQTQSVMLCRVSYMTILSEIVRVMNVRNQLCQASVTCLSPSCDSSRTSLLTDHRDVKSSNSCQVQAFLRQFVSKLLTILQLIQVLPYKKKWSSKQGAWNFVQLRHFLVCQLRSIASTHFGACPSMSWDHADCLWVKFLATPGNFSVAPAEIRYSNIFVYIVQWSFHSVSHVTILLCAFQVDHDQDDDSRFVTCIGHILWSIVQACST